MLRNTVVLPTHDLYDHRLRCLLLTHQPKDVVTRLLTELLQPFAVVIEDDVWMPCGILVPGEAKMGEAIVFLGGNSGWGRLSPVSEGASLESN